MSAADAHVDKPNIAPYKTAHPFARPAIQVPFTPFALLVEQFDCILPSLSDSFPFP
jgi:hypothetical protein